MAEGGGDGSSEPGGLLQQILSLRLVPPPGNLTGAACPRTLCHFSEMWYGVFLWALVSSIFFHIPAGLLALFTLRRHRYGKYMSVSILLMGVMGPIAAGSLTNEKFPTEDWATWKALWHHEMQSQPWEMGPQSGVQVEKSKPQTTDYNVA
ncbi:transmembrane protein 170A isoform X1 [Anolis carolinensis]|uniref:transmembrane protein 170A isoform X1 n=1 Tax=Anolis carolinensis TaxID=28377 RepID=UPI002F2B7517